MSAVHHVVPLPPPTTDPMPLKDVVGGQTNLLHRSAWDDPGNPLKVRFDPWENSAPTVKDPEQVQIFLDGVEIGVKSWTGPISPSDLYVPISADKLPSGEHSLTYLVTIWSGTPHDSYPFTLTVDKDPPQLNGSSQLIFDTSALPPKTITDRYLSQLGDKLKADLPAYSTPRPWDRIEWFWGRSPGDLDLGDDIELDDTNYSQPVVVEIPGQLIRDRGDGPRFVSYRVLDRAGNASSLSAHVELDIAATPIPRTLPWPSVEQASGPGEKQTLDPFLAVNGAIVQIPEVAVIYPGERVWVQWGEPGSLGASRVEQPITPGQRRYRIEMKSVAAHIGKTLRVDYGVIDELGAEHPSDHRLLEVQTIPSNRFKALECDGLSGGNLSYRTVAPEGARLKLDKWSLMTTDQWIMVIMTGVGTSGDTSFEAIRKRKITDQEVIAGIGYQTDIRVPKHFLNSLRRNEPLTGKVYVSFDGGQTWPPLTAPNFPLLRLTFVD